MERFFRDYIVSHEEVWQNSQTLDYVSRLHIFPEFFKSSYLKEKVLHCFCKMIPKTTRESETSPLCLHTVI